MTTQRRLPEAKNVPIRDSELRKLVEKNEIIRVICYLYFISKEMSIQRKFIILLHIKRNVFLKVKHKVSFQWFFEPHFLSTRE